MLSRVLENVQERRQRVQHVGEGRGDRLGPQHGSDRVHGGVDAVEDRVHRVLVAQVSPLEARLAGPLLLVRVRNAASDDDRVQLHREAPGDGAADEPGPAEDGDRLGTEDGRGVRDVCCGGTGYLRAIRHD